MPVARLPQLDMYYESHGSAEATPLVLLHGALETFNSGWQNQVSTLSQAYPILGLDLRGHGRSSNPAGNLDLRQLAGDIQSLLRHLGHEKIHLMGFSGGASVALCFAATYHEYLSSLMLVSNNFEQDNIRVDGNFWDAERVKREEPRRWALLNEMHDLPVEMLLRWWADEDALRPDFEPADLALIDVPTLVMAGDRDPIVPLQQTMDLFTSLPDAHLCILPGVGHGIPQRRPDAFNQIILDFLKGVERRSEKH